MSARKLVDDFKIRYEENNQRLKEWNERLLDDLDPLDWVQLMSERSYVTREILAENEDLLNELWDWIPEPMGDFEAELLYDMVMGMFFDECHDFAIMTRIGERILPYFEEAQIYECLISLYHMLGSEYSLFYRVSHDKAGLETALSYFSKAVALRNHYSSIRMTEVRRFLFRDYANMISFLDDIHPEQCKRILDLYEEMQRFLHSPQVEELDGNDGEILDITAVVNEKLLSMVDEAEDMAPWNRERLFEMTDQLYDNIPKADADPDTADIRSRIYNTSMWMQGKLSSESFLEKLIDCIERMPLPDYSSGDSGRQLRMIMGYLDYSRTILHVLGKKGADISPAEAVVYVQRFMPKVMEVMRGVPYMFQTDIMHSLCMEWYVMAAPFIQTEKEKIGFLTVMLIRRQPINYIHSLMVSRISGMLAEEIIDRRPELLVGLPGVSSPEEAQGRRQELVTYAENCGRIHDVGKCYIMDVVDQQNRRLFDSEYEMIRRHPKLGLELVKDDRVLAPYCDIILGHHKYYDGKHGYPVDFDNTLSPVMRMIGLVSIADSLDAGTDDLGRNYTSGKDLEHLITELTEGAGTRYDPEIVELIRSGDKLRDELKVLTSQGRYDVCYQAYREIAKGDTAVTSSQ